MPSSSSTSTARSRRKEKRRIAAGGTPRDGDDVTDGDVDHDSFCPTKCLAALVHHDPQQIFSENLHYKQLIDTFFGRVLSLTELTSSSSSPPPPVHSLRTVFVCGDFFNIVAAVQRTWPQVAVTLVEEFTCDYDGDDNGDDVGDQECRVRQDSDSGAVARDAAESSVEQGDDADARVKVEKKNRCSAYESCSYRDLALRIPELFGTNDRLVPLPHDVSHDADWFELLKGAQEWYALMHAKHQCSSANRTGSYLSSVGPLPGSIYLQRCSTVFYKPTQLFGPVHERLQDLQRQADGVFISPYPARDPNVMLIQEYDPDAIIGAHSDKTVDLENLYFRAFSAYEGYRNGKFDDDKDHDRDDRTLETSSVAALGGDGGGELDNEEEEEKGMVCDTVTDDGTIVKKDNVFEAAEAEAEEKHPSCEAAFRKPSSSSSSRRWASKTMLDPCDFRVHMNIKMGRPVIRFLTLKKKGTDHKIHIPLPPNYMFIMTDRTHREWTHEIRRQPFARKRISVTSRFSSTLAQYVGGGDDDKLNEVRLFRRIDDEEEDDDDDDGDDAGDDELSPTLDTADVRLKPMGLLHLASSDESVCIDSAYTDQNKFQNALPDYSKVFLCTRNPGDLLAPDFSKSPIRVDNTTD